RNNNATAMPAPPSSVRFIRRTARGGLAAVLLGLAGGQAALAAATPLVTLPSGQVEFYTTAESLVNGFPAKPARLTARFDRPMQVMKRLVSQAEYAESVLAEGCRPLGKEHRHELSPDLPAVGGS